GKYLDSSYLDRYYLKNPQGVLEINTAAGDITIDFSGNVIPDAVRIKFYDNSVLPEAVSLDLHSSEFKEVERYTKHHGLLQKHIKKIHRIQNVDLWEFYCRKKAQLMRIKGQSHIEEQRLFHGTSRDNVHSICKYNFECRLSDKRRHGCVYGKGTYFAKHASYADNYSVPDQQGFNKTQVMVLARVIVGEYKKGEDDFCKPDDDLKENLHDSCVDNPSHPTIYVIFDSNQIYPEYVLEY
uniref:Poly [ADP-ribose] polymerase n=1 Tax=Electrophorus electricus TaxID=8005 RepID=A0A4W4G1Q4_ELEEL